MPDDIYGGRDPHAYDRPTIINTSRPPARLTVTAEPVQVGVIDTGIAQPVHSWLEAHVSECPEPSQLDGNLRGHGSFVAGVVLLNALGAHVRMEGVVNDSDGRREDQQVADAIMRLADDGVRLINLSFGGAIWEHVAPIPLQEAIKSAQKKEVVVVASAANNASPLKNYPAALPGVVSVGATTSDGKVAEFSAYGSWLTVYAQGEDVTGPYEKDQWAKWSGTSFAAATVTGRIARLMAERNMDAQDAKAHLLSTCGVIKVHDVNGERGARYLS